MRPDHRCCSFPVSIIKITLLLLFSFCSFSLLAQSISTIAGNGTAGFSGDGSAAASAQLSSPAGMAIDPQGNLYFSDFGNHRVRKIAAATGLITTIAGNGTAGFSGDGGPATAAQLHHPTALCLDPQGNLYLIDSQNLRIRKVDMTTGTISTIAGNGTTAHNSGTAATATGLNQPSGLAADANGNLYISQAGLHIISRVGAGIGTITTFAGSGMAGFSGDGGPATAAQLSAPAGLATDASGNLFIADANNHLVRKISAANASIATIAGTHVAGYAGDGKGALFAQLNTPRAVWADAAGNVYFTESGNHRIRRINQSNGLIVPVAGTGTAGFMGDGGPAHCAWLDGAYQVVAASDGSLYISDRNNHRIRKILPQANPLIPEITITPTATELCTANPVRFTAQAIQAGSNLVYQWKVNGVNAGSNSNRFTLPTTGINSVVCELTSNNGCTTTVSSNAVLIGTNNGVQEVVPEVTITASSESICSGTPVTFSARNTAGSLNVSYSWLVNGNAMGTNNPTFTGNTFNNGDVVTCVLTAPHCNTGSTKKFSNTITLKVGTAASAQLSITASATSACKEAPVTFTASNNANLPQFSYQWQVNGNPVGDNRVIFTTNQLADGDVVQCVMTTLPGTPCGLAQPVISNAITIRISEATAPTLAIAATTPEICTGEQASFTATAVDAGTTPAFQWFVNGAPAGSTSALFSTRQLGNGDKVHCVVTTGNSGCVATATSNTIIARVNNTPEISFPAATLSIDAGSQVQLQATVAGNVSRFSWSPEGRLTQANTLTPLTVPLEQDTRFSLRVISAAGCVAEKSIDVKVMRKLFIPTSFTPNGDGLNDIFRLPPGTTLTLYNFSVFDRWGNAIFHTTNIAQGWNGTYKGKPLPTGIYVFVLSGRDANGPVQQKGSVLLVR